ncbi:hypothetical protein KY330_02205 [Candidatus Woesearchaeota archaeon]|nr:hypothetical protein [Candidatus Woesearchaeota archaeon]
MGKYKILNTKEIKEILSKIEIQWGAKIDLADYAILRSDKDKIYIVKKEVFDINFKKIRLNSLGIYFCEIENEIRLSIEGSQIIGEMATKNVIDIDKKQLRTWFKGDDLYVEGNYSGFVIIRHNKDYAGCGKFKEGRILNYVPKARRIHSTD